MCISSFIVQIVHFLVMFAIQSDEKILINTAYVPYALTLFDRYNEEHSYDIKMKQDDCCFAIFILLSRACCSLSVSSSLKNKIKRRGSME